ncbi:hypothetical protein BAUCODRAFT_273345 [Baudoinia panamericana UAMH 10762]|uniref:Uncharacterized protein n=1 Tax=Baudoinia panamericana (strain UAMH 10762) TaxID=717646 RepID=M2N331_BAUPA|nr:uncharacterized protein BAUCODRAFT_273345 [Baudoinia panamericana UAMH 10762]EMC93085.1 hypothetical protein BAUCODRAFT_273345 [Baudoinia panamericana UAMH 10762]
MDTTLRADVVVVSISGCKIFCYDTQTCSNHTLTRTNLQAAEVNGRISRYTPNAQLHPMLTMDGGLPTLFREPLRLEQLKCMSNGELDQIMMAYDLGTNRRRYYRGYLRDRYDDDDMFYGVQGERIRNLIALLEYLGAWQLVDQIRRVR